MGKRLAIGMLAAAGLLAASCGGGGADAEVSTTVPTTARATTTTQPEATTTTEAPRATSATIRPLFTRGDEGGVGTEIVTIEESTDGTVRLDFSEDEPGGLGDQSRAASWNAVTTATLLTGAPLSGRYGFEISGPIDGPSAGALKTVAVLSLMQGHTIAEDITMTGTINPDGTLGPVGGIPEKVLGAAAEGFTKVLIPAGQRNTASVATGELVDVVALGDREGVEVVEVDDVYDAYEHLTGESLVRLPAGSDPRLDDKVYDRLQAQTNAALSNFQQSAGVYNSLAPEIQEVLGELASDAQASAERAASLQRRDCRPVPSRRPPRPPSPPTPR